MSTKPIHDENIKCVYTPYLSSMYNLVVEGLCIVYTDDNIRCERKLEKKVVMLFELWAKMVFFLLLCVYNNMGVRLMYITKFEHREKKGDDNVLFSIFFFFF